MGRQILRINKMIIYIPIAIIIIVLREDLLDYLNFIVGIPLLVFSLESLLYELYIKNYRNELNRIGEDIIQIILSILIIAVFDDNLEIICIIWGIIAILTAVKELSKSIYEITAKRKPIYFLVVTQTLFQIFFAVLLIIEPAEEHATMHLVLLGVEILLESLRIFITFIYTYKRRKKIKLQLESEG